MVRRGMLGGAVAIALLLPAVAQAAKPAVGIDPPARGVAGQPLRIAGKLTPAQPRARVLLQQRVGRRWATRKTTRLGTARRFVVRWRPVAPGTVRLRVVVVRGRRVVAISRAKRVTVRAPASSPAPSPPGGDPPDPVPPAPPAPPAPQAPVRIPPADTVLSIPAPGSAGQVELQGTPAIAAGDFLALDIGPNSPDGFLGQVDAVSRQGQTTTVTTSPTTLRDVIPEGSLEAEITRSASRAIRRHVRIPLKCTGGGSITVEGDVEVDPHFSLTADWGILSVNRARLEGGVSATAELEAEAEASAKCTVPKTELAKLKLPAVRFMVAGVPVILTPVLTTYLAASGELEAEIETGIHGSFDATAGLEYEDGDFAPISDFTHEFGYTPPTPSASASLSGTLTTTADLLLYGLAGPRLEFAAGMSFAADTAAPDPWWRLTAPVSLTAKLAAPALKLTGASMTVYEDEFLLAEAPPRSGGWVGDIRISGSETGPALIGSTAADDIGSRSRQTAVTLRVNAPGTPDGSFVGRGQQITDYAYSQQWSDPKGWMPEPPYECVYTSEGSADSVAGGLAIYFGGERMSFGWNREDGPTAPESNWSEETSEGCSGFSAPGDNVIYGGLDVCARTTPGSMLNFYAVPVEDLLVVEDGKLRMRGTVSHPCTAYVDEYDVEHRQWRFGSVDITVDLEYVPD